MNSPEPPGLELFSLASKVALVTGSARGLGLATAQALAAAGATIVVSDLDAGASEAASATLPGGGHLGLGLDVGQPRQRDAAFDAIRKRYGRLDILVNNAGIVLRQAATQTADADFARLLHVNLVSTLAMSGLAAPLMCEGGGGRIINLSSIVGLLGRSGVATYSASKAGIIGLTRSLAAEFGPHGICVNAVAPGYLLTEMNAANTQDIEFYESVVSRTPLRRWGRVEDMAGIMIFLASAASAFVTGQAILLDGGIGVTLPGPAATEDLLAPRA